MWSAFLLALISMIPRTLGGEHCDDTTDCLIFEWQAWSLCTGPCGTPQSRMRHMCCPTTVLVATLKNCLSACNKPINFPMTDQRVCCKQGHYNSGKCLCNHGYKGNCCQDLVKCSDNPCKHGTCTDTNATFVCNCNRGYTGVDCDIRKRCNQVVTCDNGGHCVDDTIGFKCHCTDRHTGEFCERDKKCSDHPCQHGICMESPTGYTCTCSPGYTGVICERVITCASSPCEHGTCTDSPVGFVCTCNSSYTGIKCETVLTTDEESEHLPDWFPYLEYVLIASASLIALGVLGCVCLKCFPMFCVKKDDDDNEDDNLRRRRRNCISPLDR